MMFFSCKTIKQEKSVKPELPTNMNALYNRLQQENVGFKSLVIKNFTIKLDAEEQKNTLYGSLKIINNTSALLSLRAALGFEISRIYFTPDSVTLINRQAKKVFVSDYMNIKPMLPLPLNLDYLQNIFTGNLPRGGTVERIPEPVSPSENYPYMGTVTPDSSKGNTSYSVWYDPMLLRPRYMIIYKKNIIQPLHVDYKSFINAEGQQLPHEFKITYMKDGTQNFIHLKCSKFEYGQEQSIDFSYSDKYEVIYL